MKSFLILFATLLFVNPGVAANTNLIVNGKSDYKIVVSERAGPSEKSAARELQHNLKEISGVTLPIVSAPGKGTKLVYIGFTGTPKALLKGVQPNTFGEDEYLIRSDGNSLLIAGGGSRGTLYGVIGYLSDYLGCRWYTTEVKKIPKQRVISLGKIEDRQKPSFQFREVNWREGYELGWTVHNRLNPSRLPIPDSLGGNFVIYPERGHTFALLLPEQQYFAAHPEYYSEVGGKRTPSQLCLTNPEVVKLATKKVFEWIEKNPKASVYSVSQNDGEGYCECKNCKALDEKEGSQSGTLVNFVNQIAQSVNKVHPDVKLHTFAYAYTEVPPKTLKPDKNVLVELCHYVYCSAHGVENCDNHQTFKNRLETWFGISNQVTVWDYCTDFANYLAPFPNFATFADAKYYRNKNAYGFYTEGCNTPEGGGEFGQLRAWVYAQLLWNADRDHEALIDEYVANVYGPAATYVRQYIDLLHEQVKPKDVYFSIWTSLLDMSYLTPATVATADSLFALAKKAAENDAALAKRIELAYLPIQFSKLYFFSIGGTAFTKNDNVTDLVREFEQIMGERKIVNINADANSYGSLQGFLENLKIGDRYYNDWWVIGPFDNKDKQGLKTTFPPEKELNLAQSYSGKDGMKVNWRKHEETISGYIDFAKLFTPSEEAVSYAYRTIDAKEARTVKFGVGSNDGVKVWINGRVVLDRPVSRRAEPNQDIIEIPLKKGENTILVKVDQLKRGWGFYFTEKK
jgi:hypothetical protein